MFQLRTCHKPTTYKSRTCHVPAIYLSWSQPQSKEEHRRRTLPGSGGQMSDESTSIPGTRLSRQRNVPKYVTLGSADMRQILV